MNIRGERKKFIIIAVPLVVLLLFLALRFIWSKEARVKRWRNEAARAYEQGDYKDAARYYDNALAVDPSDTSSLRGRAETGLKTGELDLAKQCLDALEKQLGDSPEYKRFLYDYSLVSENYALAASLLKNLPDYTPSTKEYRKITEGLFAGAYYSQAEELLEEIRVLYPRDEHFAALSIMTYVKLDKASEALDLYKLFSPELDSEYLNYLGDACSEAGEKKKALEFWEKSLHQDINQEKVVVSLMNTLAEEGNTREFWEWRKIFLLNDFVLPEPEVNLSGSSPANGRYSGFAAQQGDYAYLADPYNEGIWEINNKTNEIYLVSGEAASYLNIRGNSLYYVERNDEHLLKRIRFEDGAVETMCRDSVKSPLLWGNVFYFINESDGDKLYILDSAEGRCEAVTDMPVQEFAPDGEYIYLIAADNHNLYRVDQTNFDCERLLLGDFSDINVDEFSQIYMYDHDLKGVVSCRNNGSHKTLILESEAGYLNYAGGKLYYVRWTPHSMNPDGSEAESLVSNFSSELIVLGEWIYSCSDKAENGEPGIYRFRTDGTDWTELTFT